MYETQRPDDWRYVLETSGADVVFASNKADELCLSWADEGLLRHVFRVDHPKDLSNLAALDWAAYRDTPTPKRDRIKVDPDATVTIIFTSGTTGKPKGVELTHRNIASNVQALSKVAKGRYGSRHVHFSFLPWAHIYGTAVFPRDLLLLLCDPTLNLPPALF
jgi:long-chain acyl-CoA synthetase